MLNQEIINLEQEIAGLTAKLNKLRNQTAPEPVPNYRFSTLEGEISLLDLFNDKHRLLAIHNMGQGCRYCTLWADLFNGMLSHLESCMSVVLLSRDTPQIQRTFAISRNWNFRLVSHGGGIYIREQSVMEQSDNMPGVVSYERKGDQVFRKNSAVFGPGDIYCPIWNLFAIAGVEGCEWTPQFRYWTRPAKLDDGGENLLE